MLVALRDMRTHVPGPWWGDPGLVGTEVLRGGPSDGIYFAGGVERWASQQVGSGKFPGDNFRALLVTGMNLHPQMKQKWPFVVLENSYHRPHSASGRSVYLSI